MPVRYSASLGCAANIPGRLPSLVTKTSAIPAGNRYTNPAPKKSWKPAFVSGPTDPHVAQLRIEETIVATKQVM